MVAHTATIRASLIAALLAAWRGRGEKKLIMPSVQKHTHKHTHAAATAVKANLYKLHCAES